MQSGQLLCNRYSIEQHLAGGGFGQTYLAIDTHLPSKPQVVVKLLKPMSTDPTTLQIAQRLFNMEAETLENLGKDRDRIPSLYAYFKSGGEFYLVQEFINGTTLTQELNARQLSESDTLAILQEILIGLAMVHSQDVIHRDLKPDNIIRRASDRKLVLIDFGAVKQVRAASATMPTAGISPTIGIGTEGYMPSEQGLGYPKPASDVYAVGAIGIQCLTGVAPHLLFDEHSLTIEWQHLRRVNVDFINVLKRMVAPDYRQRYANAAEALIAIESLNITTVKSVKPPPTPVRVPIGSPVIIPPVVRLQPTQPVRLNQQIFPTQKELFFGGVALLFVSGVMYAIRLLAIAFTYQPLGESAITSNSSEPLPTIAKPVATPSSSNKLPTLTTKSTVTPNPSNKLPTLTKPVVTPDSSKIHSKALSRAEKANLVSIKAQLITVSNSIKSGNIAKAKTQFEKVDADIYLTSFDTIFDTIDNTNHTRMEVGELLATIKNDISYFDILPQFYDSVQTSKDLTEAIRVISDILDKCRSI